MYGVPDPAANGAIVVQRPGGHARADSRAARQVAR
jgi:hypothetical protein